MPVVGRLASKLIALILTRAIAPVAFGDVKVYIARETETASSNAKTAVLAGGRG